MQLPNEWATKLTEKNPDLAQKAAKHIIDNKDIDAWNCLADNEEHIFDFVKDKVAQRLINAVTEKNYTNIFNLMQKYNDWLADIVALSTSKFDDPDINDRMLEYLINGNTDQKSYAARYFVYIDYPQSETPLIKYLDDNNETLKTNAAEALGAQKSKKAFEILIKKLNTDDEWERVSAAELLSSFGNSEAVKPILTAMVKSNMKENMASEAASIICLADCFYGNDDELKELALEAIDSITTGLPEVLPLANLIAYNYYECIDKLLKTAENEDNALSGKISQVLLRAKSKFELLSNNDQYTFDEDKETLEEIKHINNIINLRGKTFWGDMTYLLTEELDSQDFNRKYNAISTVTEIGLNFAGDKLIEIIQNQRTPEVILCKAVYALESLKYSEALKDLKKLLIRVKDPNKSAIIHNAIQVLERVDLEKFRKEQEPEKEEPKELPVEQEEKTENKEEPEKKEED